MAPPSALDLLSQLPGNFGDPAGMRRKAAQLDGVAARIDRLGFDLSGAAQRTPSYRGPAADQFRNAMEVRHREAQLLRNRVTSAQARLLRAAAVMQAAEDEVGAIGRRIRHDIDVLGDDAHRLVRDAQALVADLGRL